jgi:hypothetical protein
MAASWEALVREHGPQIAAYNAPPEPEEEEGEEQEYTVRVEFVASTIVKISATSKEAALKDAYDESLNPHDRTFEWEVIDTMIWEKP